MIKVIKFMEKAWFMISILTFLVALYWVYMGKTFDALYFFGFSIVAIFLFLARRKQRRYHERETEKKVK